MKKKPIHIPCNAIITTTHPVTKQHSMGDYGWCSKCCKKIYPALMRNNDINDLYMNPELG